MAFDTRLDEHQLVLPLQRLTFDDASSRRLPSTHHEASTILDEQEEGELEQGQQEPGNVKEQEPKSSSRQSPFSNANITPRPHNLRRSTDPVTPLNPPVHLRPAAPVMNRSRNKSPYSRHLRSRSSSSTQGYPMTRAYSSPLADTLTTLPELHPLPTPTHTQAARPASPMGMPYARRASPRRSLEEPFVFQSEAGSVGTPSVPTIEEHAELSLPSPAPTIPEDGIMPASPQPMHSTFPRSRRRPSSPLYSFAQPPRVGSPGHRILHTSASTPMLSQANAQGSNVQPSQQAADSPVSKYNESFPSSQAPSTATSALSAASSVYSLSMSASAYSGSMPSTPTSLRSRSPSISSLGTIPDSPDAEEEAMERERIDTQERLERLEKLNSMVGDRDSEELGRRMLGGSKERKRWSVCGAERRGDLEMETIWED